LGYSSSADCKLIASVVPEGGSDTSLVQPTPDGMGLVIYSSNENTCSVYEIYPQSDTPRLSRIAHLDFEPPIMAYLLPGTLIWRYFVMDRIVLKVWAYRLNHSISFSVVDNFAYKIEAIATNTAVIILSEKGISIVAIPPLLPQPPDFSDLDQVLNPTHTPPLITIAFPPDKINLRPNIFGWKMISSWCFCSTDHLYFDMISLGEDISKRHMFQIKLKSDLSSASLHAINTIDVHDFIEGYRICEDTLVSFWFYYKDGGMHCCEIYTESTSPCFANVDSRIGPTKMLLPDIGGLGYVYYPCPTSGRFVRLDTSHSVAVLDFF